jgi:hypothetical protein
MKIPFATCMVLLMLFDSCKKSTEQPDLNGTINPPVNKADTSTLLKSDSVYDYDLNGILMITSFLQWKYDDQRRIVQRTSESADYRDTFNYSFLNDRYIENCHAWYSGSLGLITNAIYYQHVKDHTDSLLFTSTGYGTAAGQITYNATYYYYNQSGQVSLEKGIHTSTGDPGYETTINYYYTGANLDSTVSRNLADQTTYTSYYSGGNCIVSKIQTDAQVEITTFTYSGIATGGLCFIYGNAQLISGTSDVTIPATSTNTSTYTYQLDAANRVVVGLLSRGGLPAQKHVFTYY